jgi:hypothetical protein
MRGRRGEERIEERRREEEGTKREERTSHY